MTKCLSYIQLLIILYECVLRVRWKYPKNRVISPDREQFVSAILLYKFTVNLYCMKRLLCTLAIVVSANYSLFSQTFYIENQTQCNVTVRAIGSRSAPICPGSPTMWVDLVGRSSPPYNSYTFTPADLGGATATWVAFEMTDGCQLSTSMGTTCKRGYAKYNIGCTGPSECLEETCTSGSCATGTNVIPNVSVNMGSYTVLLQ